jgi:hypothetical protein
MLLREDLYDPVPHPGLAERSAELGIIQEDHMTHFLYRRIKAEDLRMGHHYVDWVLEEDDTGNYIYGDPKRVLNIREKQGRIYATLDDGSTPAFYPEHVLIIKEVC